MIWSPVPSAQPIWVIYGPGRRKRLPHRGKSYVCIGRVGFSLPSPALSPDCVGARTAQLEIVLSLFGRQGWRAGTHPVFGGRVRPGDSEEARRRILSTFPMRRPGTPEDIAKAILFLASEDASWITGTFLTVDGGRDAALLDLSDLKEPLR